MALEPSESLQQSSTHRLSYPALNQKNDPVPAMKITSQQLKHTLQKLANDCQKSKFIPYEEGDLRAEAYARLKKLTHNTSLTTNTEVRFHPYKPKKNAIKCDVVVWKTWPINEDNLNLTARAPVLAVEFKYWGGKEGPGKMLTYFQADIYRLAKLVPRGCGAAFLYIARPPFRNHATIIEKARSLGTKHGVEVMIVDGVKTTV